MKAVLYAGDPIPLKFEVRGKEGAIEPTSVKVSIYSPQEEVVKDAPCEIEKSVVSYTFNSKLDGNHRAVFSVNIPPDIQKTHIIRFHLVKKEPIFSEAEDIKLMPLDEDSGVFETEGAIASTIRLLRRAGEEVTKAAENARDLAEKMTGRRL